MHPPGPARAASTATSTPPLPPQEARPITESPAEDTGASTPRPFPCGFRTVPGLPLLTAPAAPCHRQRVRLETAKIGGSKGRAPEGLGAGQSAGTPAASPPPRATLRERVRVQAREVTWLTPTTGPRSQGKPYLTIYGAEMTLRESPPGAELRVTADTYAFWAASSSGPRLRHTAGGLGPAHPMGDRRPVRHIQALCPLGRREGQASSSGGPRLHAVGASHFPSNI